MGVLRRRASRTAAPCAAPWDLGHRHRVVQAGHRTQRPWRARNLGARLRPRPQSVRATNAGTARSNTDVDGHTRSGLPRSTASWTVAPRAAALPALTARRRPSTRAPSRTRSGTSCGRPTPTLTGSVAVPARRGASMGRPLPAPAAPGTAETWGKLSVPRTSRRSQCAPPRLSTQARRRVGAVHVGSNRTTTALRPALCPRCVPAECS